MKKHAITWMTVSASLVAFSAQAKGISVCQHEPNPAERLACYDSLFKPALTKPMSDAEKAKAMAELEEGNQMVTTSAGQSTVIEEGMAKKVATLTELYWDLNGEPRELYKLTTYHANFISPLHYTTNVNRQPYSDSRGDAPYNAVYKKLETKFQLSFRAKVWDDLLINNASLWFAYTQRSMWQLWNSENSSPFRNSDYQPEITYVIPVKDSWGALPWNWNLQMLQFGFAHQSNGQGEPLSRSWNRFYAGVNLDREDVGFSWRYNQRISESWDDDDNPNLIDYIGSHEFSLTWIPGSATGRLTWNNDLKHLERGSWQLDFTYPVNKAKLDGLRWHLQLFSGYGETLLDYNHKQTSVGLGVMLFNF